MSVIEDVCIELRQRGVVLPMDAELAIRRMAIPEGAGGEKYVNAVEAAALSLVPKPKVELVEIAPEPTLAVVPDDDGDAAA